MKTTASLPQREPVRQFNIALPPSLVAELDAAARKTFTSRSAILRQGAILVLRGFDHATPTNLETDSNG